MKNMKIPQIAIFLSIVLSVYALVNLFLFYQTRPVFSLASIGTWLKFVFWFIVLAYPFGRILEAILGGQIPTLLVKVGSIWLAFMLYLTLFFLLFQLASPLINWLLKIDIKSSLETHRMVVGMLYFATLTVILAGYIYAINPKINQLKIESSKPIPGGGLTIAMVSDIHLGTIIGKNELTKLVDKINSQKPDIVLFVGDIFDEDIAPVVNGQMGEQFERINAKYGVFAVTGNHEFFSNHRAKIEYLQKHGVNVLNDTVAEVANINIVGRYDRQSNFALGQSRKTLSELAKDIDQSKFTVVLDHQPFNLNESVESGADLQLSGHTHHGQMWPLNYITQAVYEVSMGYKKIGNTHIYVSPGYGTWGPRVRLGNRPEIAVIRIKDKGLVDS
ncbi:metallophosphoesterase [Tenuifilum osseticum]|uniref:metallophosphoesterase n=1 Tax=Tenuifilum osseticum TaxID=3374723 RepID=UPI0034E3AD36